MYSWEMLSREEFEGLFAMKVPPTKQQPDFHWLTGGEIWTMCGLDRYGTLAPSLTSAPFQQSVVETAGSTGGLLS